jgi:hypothetical protein
MKGEATLAEKCEGGRSRLRSNQVSSNLHPLVPLSDQQEMQQRFDDSAASNNQTLKNLGSRCREWVSAYDFILREARGARS